MDSKPARDDLSPEDVAWGRRIGEMHREIDDEALRRSAPVVAQVLRVWEEVEASRE